MGDFIALLQHLNLSPVNTLVLAVILWFIYRLFARLDKLEGPEGPVSQLREEINDQSILIARHDERLNALEEKDE